MSHSQRFVALSLGPRVLSRCADVDPTVSAAALLCACALAKAEVLKEEPMGLSQGVKGDIFRLDFFDCRVFLF